MGHKDDQNRNFKKFWNWKNGNNYIKTHGMLENSSKRAGNRDGDQH